MAIMGMVMVRKHSVYITSTLLSISSLALANEVTFEPSISVNETYSDNISFDNANSNSSFINQTSFELISNYKSSSTSYNMTVEAINATYSHNSDFNDVYFNLISNADIELWSNGLSLVGTASISNEPRNLTNNIYSDIVFGDTIQIERYSGGLSYDFSNRYYQLNTNLLYNTTKTEDNIGENEGYSAIFNTQSNTSSAPIFWDINNNYLERKKLNSDGRSYQSEFKIGYITLYKFNPFIRYYDEGNSGDVGNEATFESNSIGAGFRWLAALRLTVDMTYNIPIDNESADSDDEQKNYYDVNVSWQPTKRTSLYAGISERFYGDSYSFNLVHSNKRLTNTISYNESVQVFTRDNFNLLIDGELCSLSNINIDCFALLQQSLINNPEQDSPTLVVSEDESFSLYKTFIWNSELTLRRTTFNLNVNRSGRENLLSKIKSLTKSVDFNVSRKLSRYSDLGFTTTYTETNNLIGFPQEIRSQYRYYKASYNRKLNNTITVGLNLSHVNRTSDSAFFVYKENRISLELKKVL